MRSTLFHIPAEFFHLGELPFGWLLILWAALAIGWLAWLIWRQGLNAETFSYLPFFAMVTLVIYLLLPGMMEQDAEGKLLLGAAGKPVGVPIRGFGVMMMAATVVSVGLAAYRGWQMGVDPDEIYTLAFWMFVAGICGARLFYIVQYWNQFNQSTNLREFLISLVNVTKGGLVVYGSVLAGVPAGIIYLWRRGLPILALGDIIAPSMVIGLALGRIGCFLNGCCYGGYCSHEALAFHFPPHSPPYLRQEEQGWDSGVWLRAEPTAAAADPPAILVAYVAPGGAAERAGVRPGQRIAKIRGESPMSLKDAQDRMSNPRSAYEIETADNQTFSWIADIPPAASAPIHATQLYAALDAALLGFFLWTAYPFRRRDGELFALLITIHPISRFLLEWIRDDEPGQFGTAWTISQWISVAIVIAAGGLWCYIERQPAGSALPHRDSELAT